MGSTTRIVDQKFFSEYSNGSTFSLNLSEFATHLKGGIGEKLKAEFTVQIEWFSELKDYDLLYDNVALTLRVVKAGVDFVGDGFSVGDSVKLSIESNTVNANVEGTVTSLKSGEITLDSISVISGTLPNGWSLGVSPQVEDFLTGLTDMTALKYKFGIIENDESFNTLSKLTSTDQIFLIDNIDHGVPLTYSTGVSFGNNKAWVTGTVSAAFSQLVADSDHVRPQDTTQEFIIKHEFVINPMYRDGEIDSLTGADIPPEDIFDGDKSLKYVFESEFRDVLNNPNTSKIARYETQRGSVGYLDESFNGYANNYSISDLVYVNITDAVSVNKLQVDKVTSVDFTITSANSSFLNTTPVVVGHMAVLDSTEYGNSTLDYNELWANETIRNTDGGGLVSGTIIKSFDVVLQSASEIDVSLEIDLPSSYQKRLSDGQYYVLYVTVADDTDTDNSDKAQLRVDVNTYEKSPDIAGLFDVDTFEHYPHPYVLDKGVTTGFTGGKAFVQDGQLAYARFKVLDTYLGPDLDLSEDVTLESLRVKVVAFDTVNNTWFDLRSLNVDLSNQVVSGNIQNIELDSTRGYILKDTDQFNFLKLTTDTNDGTWQYYDLEVGYKFPWQDWLELTGADTVFYDKTKENNGLNQNSSEYSGVNNYVIKVLIDANVETTGVTTQYVKGSGDFTIYDRETDDQIPDAYSCTINTYDSDGIPLVNNIIEKEFTEVRAIITPTTPPVFSQSVDFTEVDTNWNRFAHGNKFSVFFPRAGVWANEQANDTDTFTDNVTNFTKLDSGLYTSTSSTIEANENCNAFYGCYSLEEYQFYDIEGKMFVDVIGDNDGIVFTMAMFTDETGVDHTISLVASLGGVSLDPNPSFVVGDDTTDVFTFPNTDARFGIVYDFGKRGFTKLHEVLTGKSGFTWGQAAVGDVTFTVNRVDTEFTVTVDWTIDGANFNDTHVFDVMDNPVTEKFNRFCNIGFGFMSQDNGGFKDVVLTLPSSDYYGILRMETKDSSSDFGISELSTLYEAPDGNSLTQITGGDKKATLSWDGASFIIQGEIDTDVVNDGEEYNFSGELRKKNLGI
jgi:hypothetical protein